MRTFLATLNVLISACLWIPSQRKILQTKRAGDYHLLSFVAILLLQLSSLWIAWSDHSQALELYFLVNGLNVAVMLGLIVKYR